jgi:hypothetical protein
MRFLISVFTFVILFNFFGVYEALAQPVVHGDAYQVDTTANEATKTDLFKPKVSLSLGTSFSSFGSGYSGFGTYVAPEITMPVSKKFSVSFGIGYSSMFLNVPTTFGYQNGQSSYGSVFVAGTYQVNEKLTIRGTAYKTFLLNPTTGTKDLNAQYFDFSTQGFNVNAEYKVNDKFRIGVSIDYKDQNYPSYYPNSNSGFSTPPFPRNSFVPGL